MKKNTLLLILLFSLNLYSQNKYTVTAKSGLIIRNEPDINSYKIGKLKFEEPLLVIEKTDYPLEVESIKGYWVKITTNDLKYGYVFNGFLKPYVENKIIYSIIINAENRKSLKANYKNKETTLIDFESERCFNIIEEQDYNNDGFEEILLEMNACGGNCCGNSLLIFSYDGIKFIKTKQIGDDFNGIEINYDKEIVRHFVVDNQNIGFGNTNLCGDEKSDYIFEDFKFKLKKTEFDEMLNTIIELKAADFLANENETGDTFDKVLSIEYDLDNNGIIDKITSKYWSRWGSLHDCKIILNNKPLDNNEIGSPKRIGVLESKTNNVNDLVIECNEILQWDGTNYKKK